MDDDLHVPAATLALAGLEKLPGANQIHCGRATLTGSGRTWSKLPLANPIMEASSFSSRSPPPPDEPAGNCQSIFTTQNNMLLLPNFTSGHTVAILFPKLPAGWPSQCRKHLLD